MASLVKRKSYYFKPHACRTIRKYMDEMIVFTPLVSVREYRRNPDGKFLKELDGKDVIGRLMMVREEIANNDIRYSEKTKDDIPKGKKMEFIYMQRLWRINRKIILTVKDMSTYRVFDINLRNAIVDDALLNKLIKMFNLDESYLKHRDDLMENIGMSSWGRNLNTIRKRKELQEKLNEFISAEEDLDEQLERVAELTVSKSIQDGGV